MGLIGQAENSEALTVRAKPAKELKVSFTAEASKPEWTMQSTHFPLPLSDP